MASRLIENHLREPQGAPSSILPSIGTVSVCRWGRGRSGLGGSDPLTATGISHYNHLLDVHQTCSDTAAACGGGES